MKNLKVIFSLIVVFLVLLGISASAQFKTVINPEQRVFTIKNDTLYQHLPLENPIKYNHFQLRYLTYNGKLYRYKIAFMDKTLFYIEQRKSKKKEIIVFKN